MKQIGKGDANIKTFDYDGQRYSLEDCNNLIGVVEQDLKELQAKMNEHDKTICTYFFKLAQQQGKEQMLLQKYNSFDAINEDYQRRFDLYLATINGTSFVQYTNPYDTIESNFAALAPTEKNLKDEMARLLQDVDHLPQITSEIKDSLEKYCSLTTNYFTRPSYNDDALKIMYAAVGNYHTVISDTLFVVKQSLLEYQAGLEVSESMEFSAKLN